MFNIHFLLRYSIVNGLNGLYVKNVELEKPTFTVLEKNVSFFNPLDGAKGSLWATVARFGKWMKKILVKM